MVFGISILLFIIVLVLIVAFIMLLNYFRLWIKALAAGVSMSIFNLVRMRIMGVPPGIIVDSLITGRKAGLAITSDLLVTQYLSGGHLDRDVLSLIAAQRAGIPLDWGKATAIDLAGRNPLEAVQTSVNPKVIETPIFQGV